RLIVVGQRGRAVLTMPNSGEWLLDVNGDKSTSESFDTLRDAERTFWQISHSDATRGYYDYDDSAWLAVCRDQEAAEAVDRSLARGRTIELVGEGQPEGEA